MKQGQYYWNWKRKWFCGMGSVGYQDHGFMLWTTRMIECILAMLLGLIFVFVFCLGIQIKSARGKKGNG